MDPFSIIAGAVAAGAAAGLKETASKAVKDAYGFLSAALKKIYHEHASVADAAEHLAKKPTDLHRRQGLENELKEAGLDVNPQLVEAAGQVLKTVEAEEPEAAKTVGVDIGLLRAEAMEFLNVNAPEHGTGVRIGAADVKGTARFENIGRPTERHPPYPK
jgi:hypothetical protein